MTFLTTLDLERLKFGKMQTFWVRLKIWLKIDIFDHSACNGWNLAKSRNFQFRFKFGSKFTFLTTLDLGRLKFGKILTYFSHVEKLAQNWHFWPLRTWEGWSLAKFRNFQSRWKFGLNWEFDHSGPAKDEIWIKFGKIQKFSNASNIWPKIETFDHSGPVKEEIWHIQKFWVVLKIWFKNEIFDHSGPANDGIWQYLKFSVPFKIWIKIVYFWPLWTCEGWKLAKCRHFESGWKFGSKLTFLTTKDLQRMKLGKILKFSVAVKILLKLTLRLLKTCDG